MNYRISSALRHSRLIHTLREKFTHCCLMPLQCWPVHRMNSRLQRLR